VEVEVGMPRLLPQPSLRVSLIMTSTPVRLYLCNDNGHAMLATTIYGHDVPSARTIVRYSKLLDSTKGFTDNETLDHA